jgi:lipopolysaccharide export LptBFGC system permease protein LptF
MILSRYLLREIAAHLGAVFAVVLAVFLTRRLGIYLGEALEGEIAASVVFEALGLRTVMSLPSLLPPVLYLAILLGLGRLHEDLELTALAACGVSPDRIARIVVGGAAVAAIAIGVLSLEVRPRAAERVKRVEERATAEARIGSLRPGRFYELGGERVVFAEDSGPGAIEDVFVHAREADATRVYRATRASGRARIASTNAEAGIASRHWSSAEARGSSDVQSAVQGRIFSSVVSSSSTGSSVRIESWPNVVTSCLPERRSTYSVPSIRRSTRSPAGVRTSSARVAR